MKKVLIWNLFLLLGALSSAAFANEGGVGSGGGGTTNPEPADKEWVVKAANQYAGKVITAWLYKAEESFRSDSEEEKKESRFAKLFNSANGKSIYDVVKNTEVEYRMNAPCRDAEGNPADGSIYGTKPGSICISPFSMAPKLNEYNVDAETMALMLHEYSHLMGASEEEAVKIQQWALYSFMQFNTIDVAVKIDLLATPSFNRGPNDLSAFLFSLNIAETYLRNETARKHSFGDLVRDALEIRRKVSEEIRWLLFVKPGTTARITADGARLMFLETAACALDHKEDPELRAYCQEQLDKGFGPDEKVNLRTYEARLSGMDESIVDQEFAAIEITKPRTQRELLPHLEQLKARFTAVQKEIDFLKAIELPGYRTN